VYACRWMDARPDAGSPRDAIADSVLISDGVDQLRRGHYARSVTAIAACLRPRRATGLLRDRTVLALVQVFAGMAGRKWCDLRIRACAISPYPWCARECVARRGVAMRQPLARFRWTRQWWLQSFET
jgi:hypothetical protein